MARSSNKASLKVDKAKEAKLKAALDLLEAHVGSVAIVWRMASPKEKDAVLAHSPIFARIRNLALTFGDAR